MRVQDNHFFYKCLCDASHYILNSHVFDNDGHRAPPFCNYSSVPMSCTFHKGLPVSLLAVDSSLVLSGCNVSFPFSVSLLPLVFSYSLMLFFLPFPLQPSLYAVLEILQFSFLSILVGAYEVRFSRAVNCLAWRSQILGTCQLHPS